jgi:hypothetical protein
MIDLLRVEGDNLIVHRSSFPKNVTIWGNARSDYD